MAKLADIDSGIRIGGKIAAVFVGALVLLFIFITGGQFFKNLFFPTPPAAPTEKFGKLPPLDFPPQDPQKLSYNVNTLTGVLPELDKRMNVYQVKKSAQSLAALSDARALLRGGRYDLNETKLDDSNYQWTNSDNGTNITYNIGSKDFKISSDLLSQPPKNLTGISATKEGAYDSIISFLQSIGQNTEGLSLDDATITYLKIQDGLLVGTSSQNDAQYLRVDLFPKSFDTFSTFYPGDNESIMYFIVKSEDFNPQIVDGSYSNPIPNKSTASDYSIITAEQAFDRLKKGEALVFNKGKSQTVDVTDVFLGYYVTPQQDYFMPVVVFKGKNFLGLVNALP